jgi:8-oxo-dGTP diphosphatase
MNPTQQFPKLGASACVWRDHQVLLIQRAKPPVGLWSLPGGHVEFGETARAAAGRELREETGVVAELSELLGLYEIIRGSPPLHYAVACYYGAWVSGEPVAASDALSACWVSPAELYHLDFVPHVKEAIARAQNLMKN